MKSRKKRRTYDDAFKIETVKAWNESGKSAPEFAGEYGIPENNLYNWARKLESGGGVISPDMHGELQRLRMENERLRKETAILKKAMGYFANQK